MLFTDPHASWGCQRAWPEGCLAAGRPPHKQVLHCIFDANLTRLSVCSFSWGAVSAAHSLPADAHALSGSQRALLEGRHAAGQTPDAASWQVPSSAVAGSRLLPVLG